MAAYSNLSDEERVRLATRKGGRMLGPLERDRCAVHKRRWVIFRWVWSVPDETQGETQLDALQSDSEAVMVRSCSECEAEE